MNLSKAIEKPMTSRLTRRQDVRLSETIVHLAINNVKKMFIEQTIRIEEAFIYKL